MGIRRILGAIARPFPIALGVTFMDAVTKEVARATIPQCLTHDCARTHVAGLLELARVSNSGSAFGYVQGLWLWTVIAAVALIAAITVSARAMRRSVAVGAALLAGGGFANLIDRVASGAVTDFIGGGPLVFNLADVALVIGCILMTVGLYRGMRLREKIGVESSPDRAQRTSSL